MDVSPNALRKETAATMKEVSQALVLADNAGPEVKASLLLAKVQCLNTLTLLNEQGKRR